VVGFVADLQIRLPEEKPPLLHLAEIAIFSRVASTPLHNQGKPPSEPPLPPGQARVSALLSRGQRKKTALGRRCPFNRTADTARYPFGLLSRWWADPACQPVWNRPPAHACAKWAGPVKCSPGSVQLGPCAFF
jgi:hypothetical protein